MTTRRLVTLIAAALIISMVPGIALGATVPPGGTFTDDDGNTHEGSIEAIATTGITKGCNPPFNDHYCPDLTVTRSTMAAFLRRAFKLPSSGTDFFGDDDASKFEDDINALAAAGITKGCNPPANDRYCPRAVVNRGAMAAFLRRALDLPATSVDFFIDDETSTFEADINALAAAGVTKGCNPPANDRYCPGDSVRRDQMASFLARALEMKPIQPPPRPPLGWEVAVTGLSRPVQTLAPPGENRLLIAEQAGLVKIATGGSVSPTPMLDIRSIVSFGSERGLLSIAVHPDYPADRRLFAWFYGKDGSTHLVEYDIDVSLNIASSPWTILSVKQPFSNHNGGFVDFGPDGYLYLGLGDGGGANDPGGRARDLGTLLGKMIRIDVDGAHPYEIPPDNPYVGKSGRDEIWASGLRNPWRWSHDGGYMYIGDVGQDRREEVDIVELKPAGYDFGWSRYEASICNENDTDPSCSQFGLTFPVHEYDHVIGFSVTGGIVYRGSTVRSLLGFYIFSDFGTGLTHAIRFYDNAVFDSEDLTSQIGKSGIVDFSSDGSGELLATSLPNGTVYRLTGG